MKTPNEKIPTCWEIIEGLRDDARTCDRIPPGEAKRMLDLAGSIEAACVYHTDHALSLADKRESEAREKLNDARQEASYWRGRFCKLASNSGDDFDRRVRESKLSWEA